MEAMGFSTVLIVKAVSCLAALLFVSVYLQFKKKGFSGLAVSRSSLRIIERLKLNAQQEIVILETATEQLTVITGVGGGSVISRTSRVSPLLGRAASSVAGGGSENVIPFQRGVTPWVS